MGPITRATVIQMLTIAGLKADLMEQLARQQMALTDFGPLPTKQA